MSDDGRRAFAALIAACAGGIPSIIWVDSGGSVAYPIAIGSTFLALALILHVRREAR